MKNTIYIDSTQSVTDMCIIGGNNNTDKSPLSLNSPCSGHRKGYTSAYSMLFSSMRNKPINFAEIGVEQGNSLLMWSEWFPHASIYAFELDQSKIDLCRVKNIDRVQYHQTDVSNIDLLRKSFYGSNALFDILIDDSSHIIEHQNIIIKTSYPFLKSGGVLVIEDLDRGTEISSFEIDSSKWSFHTFIVCDHSDRNCWNNDKILVLWKR